MSRRNEGWSNGNWLLFIVFSFHTVRVVTRRSNRLQTTPLQEQVEDLTEEEPVVLKSSPDQVLSFAVQALGATSSCANVPLLPWVWVVGAAYYPRKPGPPFAFTPRRLRAASLWVYYVYNTFGFQPWGILARCAINKMSVYACVCVCITVVRRKYNQIEKLGLFD